MSLVTKNDVISITDNIRNVTYYTEGDLQFLDHSSQNKI